MIKYTKEEEEALAAIEEKYKAEYEAAYNEMIQYDMKTELEDYLRTSEKYNNVVSKIQSEREAIHNQAKDRALEEFKGDTQHIVEALKEQIPTFIYVSKALAGEEPTEEERKKMMFRIQKERQAIKMAIKYNEKLLLERPDDEELLRNTNELKAFDPAEILQARYDALYSEQALIERIKETFKIYFDYLEEVSREALEEINAFIIEAIRNKDSFDLESSVYIKPSDKGLLPIARTKYPSEFISPTDKVSSLAFSGDLTGEELKELAMESRGSKKQITTLASIDFDNLNGSIRINGRQELTAYDREVHDAIITLFVDGKNEYITPQMIYQVITGNPNAYLEKKQAEAISDSITKCMYSKLTINADEEAKAYGFDSFKYEGNLISGERVTATLNGKTLECLRILRPPVLYEYASKKNQIGRFDIKLLNSPINKTEEIIMLQGYLYRRILSMKSSSNLSKTIVYDTVYNQIEIEAVSDGALRKKKAKVRDHIKKILDYWKQEDFIAGYAENTKGKIIYSVTVLI